MKKITLLLALSGAAALFIVFKIRATSVEPPREQFAGTTQQERPARILTYIYPDRGAQAEAYRTYFDQLETRRRYFAVRAVPASAADSAAASEQLFLLGTPASNPQISNFAAYLPLEFADRSFSINGTQYDNNADVVVLSAPSPNRSVQSITIISGNDDRHILAYLQRSGRRMQRYGDYTVLRGNQVVAYGFLSSLSTKSDINADVHFLRDKKRIFENSTLIVDFFGTPPDEQKLLNFLMQQQQLARRQLRQLAFQDSARALPIKLTLYDTAEHKTIATGDSRLSSWQPGDDTIHIVFNSALLGDDFTAIAEYLCWQWAGSIPNDNIRMASGILFSHAWGREGYPVLAGRFFHNDFFVPFVQLFTNNPAEEHSPFVIGAELATFLQFILFHNGAASLKAVLHTTPATLNQAEITRRFPSGLQDSWQRWCQNMLQNSQPDLMAGGASFLKGFCYAHEGYSVYNGYMGTTSRASLTRLAELGANAISITPFGYPRSNREPTPMRRSNGTGSENDESLIVAGHFAREQGMQVMLKPHLWAGRSWPGDIKMDDPAHWPKFFHHYEQWIAHYALLAQMCRFEHLVIGVEMVQATVGHEAEWHKLIARLRKLYGGKLVYAANWGDEFEKITFWDALDAIGVNCYYPLSKSENPQPGDLLQGARKNMRLIESVAQKYGKPVIITEIGFASRSAPWILPYIDGRGQMPEMLGQRQSYEAVIQAFSGRNWLQGIYWWKWPSDLRDGGLQHTGFTPNGKPAEQVIADWYLQ